MCNSGRDKMKNGDVGMFSAGGGKCCVLHIIGYVWQYLFIKDHAWMMDIAINRFILQ